MLAKLVKFVLLTRFSKPLLGLVTFFLAYDVVIRTVTTGNSPEFSGGFSYYAVGASIFFIAVSLLFGGLFVLKSDRDYLLTLPLKRRELSLSLFGFAAVTVPVALRELAYLELGSMRSILRATSSEYKKTMSFAGKRPVQAIYSYHLSFLELVGRVNLAGSTSYRAARVRTSTVLIISSALAAIYLFLTGLSPFADLLSRPVVIVLPILMGIITLVLMSQGTFSNERGWLAFTAMDPAVYLRHLLLSRAVSTLAITGPFAVANIVLAFRGVPVAVNSSIVLLITVSSASILATYLVARLGAVQQVKEEGMMPGQFDLKQLLAIIPTYIVIILIVVSEISLIACIIVAGVLGILSLSMMISKGVWRGIAYRLTERGFV